MTQHDSGTMIFDDDETKIRSEWNKKRSSEISPEGKSARRRVSADSFVNLDGFGEHEKAVVNHTALQHGGQGQSLTKSRTTAETTKGELVLGATEMTDKQKSSWMRHRFKQNEKTIVPILEALHAVNEQTGTKRIRSLLSQLSDQVDQMCWEFIRQHLVPLSLKPAKKALKARGEYLSQVVKLKEKMKARFEKNKEKFVQYTPKELCHASYLGTEKSKNNSTVIKSGSKRLAATQESPEGNGRHGAKWQLREESSVPKPGYSASVLDPAPQLHLEKTGEKYVANMLPKYPAPQPKRRPESSGITSKIDRILNPSEDTTQNAQVTSLASRPKYTGVGVKRTKRTDEVSASVGKPGSSKMNALELPNLPVAFNYGKPEDEIAMREWLDSNRLPQTTGNYLLQQGARCVQDVYLLLQECPDGLRHLPPLDLIKLKKAFGSTAMAPNGTLIRIKQEDFDQY